MRRRVGRRRDSSTVAHGALTLCGGGGIAGRCVKTAWPFGYSAYKQKTYRSISWHGSVLEDNRDASGLLYKRNRYLDPNSGQFTQEDPIGLAGGMNLYGFASADPVSFGDPFGLCTIGKDCLEVLKRLVSDFLDSPGGSVAIAMYGMQRSFETAVAEGFDDLEAESQSPFFMASATSPSGSDQAHGNSKASTRPQHGYAIYDANGNVMKYGISGQPLNKNGTSPRANKQVNLLNKGGGGYSCTVLVTCLSGRQAALDWEVGMVTQYKTIFGVQPPLQKQPNP